MELVRLFTVLRHGQLCAPLEISEKATLLSLKWVLNESKIHVFIGVC